MAVKIRKQSHLTKIAFSERCSRMARKLAAYQVHRMAYVCANLICVEILNINEAKNMAKNSTTITVETVMAPFNAFFVHY